MKARHTANALIVVVMALGTGCGELPLPARADRSTPLGHGTVGVVPEAPAETASPGAGQTVCLASALSPVSIAVNESQVYVVLRDGRVVSVPVTGGEISVLYSSPFALDANIVVDPNRAYWPMNKETAPNGEWLVYLNPSIGAVPLTGGLLSRWAGRTGDLASLPTEQLSEVHEIAVDGANLYAVVRDRAHQGSPCSDGIRVLPLDGSPTTDTPICLAEHIAVDSSNIYWTDPAYWHWDPTSNEYAEDPGILVAPLSGGEPAQLARARRPHAIAVHDGALFWTDTLTGNIVKLNLDGHASAVLLATSRAPGEMVVDSSGVYWIDGGSAILSVSLDGGVVTTLATGQTAIGIAVNPTSVLWINAGTPGSALPDGSIVRVAK